TAGSPKNAPARAVVPFDATQAGAHQEAWAKYLGTTVETTNRLGMKFALIPPGEFMMGAQGKEQQRLESLDAEQRAANDPFFKGSIDAAQRFVDSVRSCLPPHRVTLTRPFVLGQTEVTIGQFRRFIEATKRETENELFKRTRNESGRLAWSDPSIA